MDIAQYIRNIPDFPKPGIQFKDVTTLLQEPAAFRHVIDVWTERYREQGLDGIVGVDARGFIFGAPLAYTLGLPFVPTRKKGKLPGERIGEDFELEYGIDTIEVHVDCLPAGSKVIIVDDLLATGGTVRAATKLMAKLGIEVLETAFVIELPLLGGRERLAPVPVHSLVQFMVH
jgi:adenine phosphoribosyltransferase